ncbi:MAG: hypothetical protein AAFU61_03815 [Pseudomonadota bacterium]
MIVERQRRADEAVLDAIGEPHGLRRVGAEAERVHPVRQGKARALPAEARTDGREQQGVRRGVEQDAVQPMDRAGQAAYARVGVERAEADLGRAGLVASTVAGT